MLTLDFKAQVSAIRLTVSSPELTMKVSVIGNPMHTSLGTSPIEHSGSSF